MTTLIGIIFGLATAFSQSIAYLYSRRYVMRHPAAFWRLLVVSHLYMGAVALLGLPLVWPDTMPPFHVLRAPLLGTAGFYVIAQAGLFIVMRMTPPSRVAPLLGAKILILAILATGVFDKSLSLLQWLAVAACFGAVLTLNFAGGSLPLKAIAMLLFTCTGYSLSDLHIDQLVHTFDTLSIFHAAVLAGLLAYVLLGIAALIPAAMLKPRQLFANWKLSVPFACFWLLAMLTLFFCIGLVGPVFAIILQSSRGLMSILIGIVVARHGALDIETHVPRHVLLQRIAAAALMTAAVTLYVI